MTRFVLFVFLAAAFGVVQVLGASALVTTHWAAFGLLGVVGIGMVLPTKSGGPRASRLGLALGIAAAVYLAIRSHYSPDAYDGRSDFLLIAGCLVVYVASATLVHGPRLRWALLCLLVVFFLGHLFWSRGILFGAERGQLRAGGGGRLGFYVPGHLAAWLLGTAFLFIGAGLFGRIRILFRIVLAFLGLLALVAVVLTKSRAGILAAGAGTLAFLAVILPGLWTTRRFYFWRIVIPAAGAAVLFLFLLAPIFGSTLPANRDPGQPFAGPSPQSVQIRKQMAVDFWHESPLTGNGGRSYQQYARKHRPPSLPSRDPYIYFVHSEYHQTLAEYGVVGLALILAFGGFHLFLGAQFADWTLRRYYPATGHASPMAFGFVAGALGGLAALLVHALHDHHFHVPAVALLAAYLFGILANPGYRRLDAAGPEVADPDAPEPDVRARQRQLLSGWSAAHLATAALGAMLLVGCFRYGVADHHLDRARAPLADDASVIMRRIGHCLRVRDLDPRNHEALFLSADAHATWADVVKPELRQTALERALELAEECRRLAPGDVSNLRLLGSIRDRLAALRRHEARAALANYTKTGSPASKAAADASEVLFQEHRAAAEEAFLAALRESPRDAIVRTEVGTHYHRHGDWERAEAFYRSADGAFATWNQYPELVAYRLGKLAEDRGRPERSPAP